MIFRLAVRNITRNLRRSALAILGIGLGLGMLLLSRGLENGAWSSMVSAAISGSAGHVVVQAEGWQQERDVDLVVPDSTAVAEILQRAYPAGTVVRRLFVSGLITSPTGSAPVTLQGMQPELEAGLTLLDDKLSEGEWLSTDDPRGMLIGHHTATRLGVGLGDKVVLMAQVGSDVDSRLFRVRGIFRTGSEALDAFTVMGTLEAAQELMGGSDPAHQVAMVMPGAGMERLEEGVQLPGLPVGTEVLGWAEALPVLKEQMELDASFGRVMYGFMAAIVAIMVMNAILMGVMERMREFGMMLAVGIRRDELARLILLEGAVIGVLGATFGVLISLLLSWPLMVWGIDYGDVMGQMSPVEGVPIDTVMRSRIDPYQLAFYAVAAVFTAIGASAWPAWKVTRLQPVDAMRHT